MSVGTRVFDGYYFEPKLNLELSIFSSPMLPKCPKRVQHQARPSASNFDEVWNTFQLGPKKCPKSVTCQSECQPNWNQKWKHKSRLRSGWHGNPQAYSIGSRLAKSRSLISVNNLRMSGGVFEPKKTFAKHSQLRLVASLGHNFWE